MELKSRTARLTQGYFRGSNCTFMELKFKQGWFANYHSKF